jgi:hypothetical protein
MTEFFVKKTPKNQKNQTKILSRLKKAFSAWKNVGIIFFQLFNRGNFFQKSKEKNQAAEKNEGFFQVCQ